jgi:hypothetical protein
MTINLVAPSLVGTAADLQTFAGTALFNNHIAIVQSISATAPVRATYRFSTGSNAPDNNQSQLAILPTTSPATGHWLRCDPVIDLVLPVTFANTDNQNLVTIPTGFTLAPIYAATMLEVTTAWAGGAASTIGLSYSTPSLARTKGNLAGGAAGNAGFTSTFFAQMTLGSQFAAGLAQAPVLSPASVILFDRITSAFTSGAGNFHIPCLLYATTITPVAPP